MQKIKNIYYMTILFFSNIFLIVDKSTIEKEILEIKSQLIVNQIDIKEIKKLLEEMNQYILKDNKIEISIKNKIFNIIFGWYYFFEPLIGILLFYKLVKNIS